MKITQKTGFTLIELMVVISIIGLLSAIVYANFSDARAQSRDKVRMTALKEVQLALEFYKAQNGSYPNPSTGGCGGSATDWFGPGPVSVAGLRSCTNYIPGLTPDFITSLPTDPTMENISDKGYFYRSNGTSYKVLSYDVIEKLTIGSGGDEFARCPATGGGCGSTIPATTYAVYSVGAETW